MTRFIGLVSDNLHAFAPDAPGAWPAALCRHARAAGTRCQVRWWLTAPTTVAALASKAALGRTGPEILPATCRYVVPYQAYGYEGVPLYCVDREVWAEPPLHTRLFTLLQLLQRAEPGALWHVWGTLPAVYVAVYTACFLSIPVVVWYGPSLLQRDLLQNFMWRWVAGHATAGLVADVADASWLQAQQAMPAERLHVVAPGRMELDSLMVRLSQEVRHTVKE